MAEQKRASLEARRDQITIARADVDSDGLVWVYDKQKKKWVRRSPIDAKEGLAVGSFARSGPRGNLPAGAEQVTRTGPTDEEKKAATEAFGGMPVPMLKDLCADNQIEHGSRDTKDVLIEKLVKAGVVPPTDENPAGGGSDDDTDTGGNSNES